MYRSTSMHAYGLVRGFATSASMSLIVLGLLIVSFAWYYVMHVGVVAAVWDLTGFIAGVFEWAIDAWDGLVVLTVCAMGSIIRV